MNYFQTTIVQILLENGADVNPIEENHETALMAASYEGHEAVVKMLLENEADVNRRWNEGNALNGASLRGHEVIVQMLLEHGADVNPVQKHCEPALMTASYNGHEAVVKMLLENEADVNRIWYEGTALNSASLGDHEVMLNEWIDD